MILWAAKQCKSHWYLFTLFSTLLVLGVTAGFGQDEWGQEGSDYTSEPAVKIILPSKSGVSEYYYVQPVNIILTNVDESDGLVELIVNVASNPPGHQHVFSASFAAPARVNFIGARLRLAGEGRAVVNILGKTRTGKEITTTAQIKLDEGVDFSDENSLTKRLPANVKGLQGPIGTARARIWKKGKYTRQLSTIIYHPMLPQIGKKESNRLKSLNIQYHDKLLGLFEFGDAISNDPYIDVHFMDQEPHTGAIRIQWKDINGNIYEPVKVSVQR